MSRQSEERHLGLVSFVSDAQGSNSSTRQDRSLYATKPEEHHDDLDALTAASSSSWTVSIMTSHQGGRGHNEESCNGDASSSVLSPTIIIEDIDQSEHTSDDAVSSEDGSQVSRAIKQSRCAQGLSRHASMEEIERRIIAKRLTKALGTNEEQEREDTGSFLRLRSEKATLCDDSSEESPSTIHVVEHRATSEKRHYVLTVFRANGEEKESHQPQLGLDHPIAEELAAIERNVVGKEEHTDDDFGCAPNDSQKPSSSSVPEQLAHLETRVSGPPIVELRGPGAYQVNVILPQHRMMEHPLPITATEPLAYLVEASLVTDDPVGGRIDVDEEMAVVEAKPVREVSVWKSRRVQCTMLLIVLLATGVAVGVTVGLMSVRSGSSNNESLNEEPLDSIQTTSPTTTPNPLEWFAELRASLPNYTVNAIDDDQSPQFKAFEWIRRHPPEDNTSLFRQRQRFALATLFYATDGDQWENKEGWLNTTSHECTWFMSSNAEAEYSCFNGTDSIVALRLVRNGLNGTIPAEVALLSSLEILRVELNPGLEGKIPDSIRDMNLTEIHLNDNVFSGGLPELDPNTKAFFAWGNKLEGTFPPSYSNWTALDCFNIRSNMITGNFSKDMFSSWKAATWIDVSDNKLVGTLSSQIGLLSSLTTLSLATNEFTGQVPSEVGLLTGLHDLVLGENLLTGAVPTELGDLRRLVHLDLASNSISGRIPTELGFLTNMEELRLDENSLTGPLPSELASLHLLKTLSANGNALNGTIPAVITALPSVQVLELEHNKFSGTIPAFSILSSVTELRLGSNWLSSTIPTVLGLLRDLKVLHLDVNLLSGGIPSELGMLDNLEELDVSGNNLNGSVPEELCVRVRAKTLMVEIDCDKVTCDCGCTCCSLNATAGSVHKR